MGIEKNPEISVSRPTVVLDVQPQNNYNVKIPTSKKLFPVALDKTASGHKYYYTITSLSY